MTMTARATQCNFKAAIIIQPVIQSQNHATIYLEPWGWTHACTHTHAHTHAHTRTRTHTHAHAHTHTHTHT